MQILLWFMVDMLIRYCNFVMFVIVGSEIYILLFIIIIIIIIKAISVHLKLQLQTGNDLGNTGK